MLKFPSLSQPKRFCPISPATITTTTISIFIYNDSHRRKGSNLRIKLTQENLAKALAVVGRIVSTRATLPVLSNILLSADANRLKLAATNLEVGINYWMGCKVEESGSLTVPARLFGEYIASLPSGNIELVTDNLALKVNSPHYKSTINGISAEEFPLIPEIKAKSTLALPVDKFRDALMSVAVAASLDEARPVLAGVYIHIDESNLVLVATDSYRLAEKKLKLSKAPEEKLSAIVPVRTIQELIRILGEGEGEIKLHVKDNQIMFELENIQLVSRLIEGHFPNYRQIIPAKTETSLVIDTAEFSRITKVASLFARENAGSARLEIDAEKGRLDILSTASQLGENTSSADCDVEGESGEISLNSRYLTDALGVIKSEEVNFALSGKLNPCLITPGDQKKPDYLHIIMPLRT